MTFGDADRDDNGEIPEWARALGLAPHPEGGWYRETGSGMGPALNTASGMNAYILADRGTWLSFRNRGGLAIAVEGDKRLFNQYGVILVDKPHVKKALGQRFIDWQHSQLFTRVADDSDRADPNLPVDPDPLFPLVG